MPTIPKGSNPERFQFQLWKDLVLKNKEPAAKENISLESLIDLPLLDNVSSELIESTYNGLREGDSAVLATDGTGGAYLIMGALGGYVAVFKPTDEEPNAVNNPRTKMGFTTVSTDGEGLKKGTTVGKGAVREVAAYILDHPIDGHRFVTGEERGFSGVPFTLLVKCFYHGFCHSDGVVKEKIGSLQKFVENYGSCEEDYRAEDFPTGEVHKIAVLDIRMANADRHFGNILKTKGEDGRVVLIPIDHGYCLPNCFQDCTLDWLYWPQAQQSFSPETVDYINSLDAEEDIALLNSNGCILPPECARILRISTMLLKKGVQHGLTPFAIGSIMCREIYNEQSVIEEIVQEANDLVLPGSNEAAFMNAVSQIMDGRLAGLIP